MSCRFMFCTRESSTKWSLMLWSRTAGLRKAYTIRDADFWKQCYLRLFLRCLKELTALLLGGTGTILWHNGSLLSFSQCLLINKLHAHCSLGKCYKITCSILFYFQSTTAGLRHFYSYYLFTASEPPFYTYCYNPFLNPHALAIFLSFQFNLL